MSVSPSWIRSGLGWRRLLAPRLIVPGKKRTQAWLIHGGVTLLALPVLLWRSLAGRGGPAGPPRNALFASRTHLGDFLMAVPALRLFREDLPECRTTVVIQGKYAGALKVDAVADAVLEGAAEEMPFLQSFRWWRRLFAAQTFDAVIFHRITRPDFPAVLAAFWCGVPTRVGGADKGLQALLTHGYFPERRERIADYHLNLVAAYLGIAPFESRAFLRWPELHRPAPAPAYDLLLVPYAQHSKTWNDASWRRLFAYGRERGFTMALVGSADQRAAAAALAAGFPEVANLCGETDLNGLFNLVAAAKGLIGLDTGTRHVAAALGIPYVLLANEREHRDVMGAYVATERYLVTDVPCAPCGAEPCPLGHLRCIRDTPPEAAIAAFEEFYPRVR